MSKRTLMERYGQQLAERDGGWFCHYCGIRIEPPKGSQMLHSINGRGYFLDAQGQPFDWGATDHVLARARGGADTIDNLVLACQYCNSAKSARPYAEFKAKAKQFSL